MEADPSSPHSIRSEDGKIAVPTELEKDSGFFLFLFFLSVSYNVSFHVIL